ncbi:MAG TPA: DUF559 domain-containing protein [Baekduia sp.]|nr:DUF559 domain-containing protein [Baekduia sp.]
MTLHHPRRLGVADTTTLRATPITTVARTLVDLADILDRDRLERAVHETEVLRLIDVDAVHDAIARAPGRSGRRRLLALLETYTAAPPTRNDLERRFLRLCRDYDLPTPRTNVHVDLGRPTLNELDAVFEAPRVIVELDGAAVHHTRRAFEDDRARDGALAARGWVVVRVTWRRLCDEPGAVAGDLRQIFRARMTQFQDTSSRSPGTFITGRAHGQ